MKLFRVLRRVDIKNAWVLIKLCLYYPLFIIPTLMATKKCIAISTTHYGRQHYKNGPANAFRHALWNFLIAKRCHSWRRNEQKVMTWTKKITDWHEGAFPNRELAREMDLHNNEIGRALFLKHAALDEESLISLLKQMTQESVKVDSISDLENLKNKMIHIIDTP